MLGHIIPLLRILQLSLTFLRQSLEWSTNTHMTCSLLALATSFPPPYSLCSSHKVPLAILQPTPGTFWLQCLYICHSLTLRYSSPKYTHI